MNPDDENENRQRDEKLDQLKAKIAEKDALVNDGDQAGDKPKNDDMAKGLRAGWEFVISVLAGAGLGYWVDTLLDTSPLFLILLLFLGMGAGFLNIYKITNNVGVSIGFSPLHKSKKKDK